MGTNCIFIFVQVVIENQNNALEYDDIVVDQDSPVRADMFFDKPADHLYVMTTNKVGERERELDCVQYVVALCCSLAHCTSILTCWISICSHRSLETTWLQYLSYLGTSCVPFQNFSLSSHCRSELTSSYRYVLGCPFRLTIFM